MTKFYAIRLMFNYILGNVVIFKGTFIIETFFLSFRQLLTYWKEKTK